MLDACTPASRAISAMVQRLSELVQPSANNGPGPVRTTTI